ncbi:MAG: PKD domain-containing protein [Thermoplasmatota archaeon]
MNYTVLVFAALLFAGGIGAAIAGIITFPDEEGSEENTAPSVHIWYDEECDIFPVQEVQFISMVEGGNGELNYVWTWGYEQVLSSEPNPIITFSTPGAYLIALTVTDEDGDTGSDQVEIQTGPTRESHHGLRVDPGNEFFENDTTYGNGLTFDQDNEFESGRSEIMIMAYPEIGYAPMEVFLNTMLLGMFNWFTWDFGDGTNFSGPSSAYHTFGEPGNYTVTLVAGSTATGNIETATKIIRILEGTGNNGGTGDLGFDGWNFGVEIDADNVSGEAPLFINLRAVSHGYPNQELGLHWILDENINLGYTESISWALTEPGTHRITLVAWNYYGWTSWDQAFFEVHEPSGSEFEAHILITEWNENNRISMSGFGINGMGNLSYEWYIDDVLHGEYQYEFIHFNTPGEKVISLIITDEAGDTAQAVETIFISIDTIPIPVISYTTGMYEMGVRHFHADVTGGNGDITYEWDFGDGYQSQEMNPSHTYDRNGQYIVSVRTTDEDGDWYEDAVILIILEIEDEF